MALKEQEKQVHWQLTSNVQSPIAPTPSIKELIKVEYLREETQPVQDEQPIRNDWAPNREDSYLRSVLKSNAGNLE